jgi:hypothetical protein
MMTAFSTGQTGGQLKLKLNQFIVKMHIILVAL